MQFHCSLHVCWAIHVQCVCVPDVCVCVLIISSYIGQVVNITVVPSDATLLVGQDLTVQCTTDLIAEITVRINDESTATNPRVVDTNPNSPPNDRIFQFTSVTREDNGLVFTCFVSNNGGVYSDEVILNVQCELSAWVGTSSCRWIMTI